MTDNHSYNNIISLNFISYFPENYNQALEEFQAWYLRAMFERFSGKVNQTARILGISKTTLINKAKKYEINTLKIRAEVIPKKERLSVG